MNAPPTPACGFQTIWPSCGPVPAFAVAAPETAFHDHLTRIGQHRIKRQGSGPDGEPDRNQWTIRPRGDQRTVGRLVIVDLDRGLVSQITSCGIHGEQRHIRLACLPLNARSWGPNSINGGYGLYIVPRLDIGRFDRSRSTRGGSILAAAAVGTSRRTEVGGGCLGATGGRAEDLGKRAPNAPRCVFVRADDHYINAPFARHFHAVRIRVAGVTIHPDLDIDGIRLPVLSRHAVAKRCDD